MTYVEEPGLEDLDDEFAEDSELSDDLEQYAPAPLDPGDQQFVDRLVSKVWDFTVIFSGVSMFPYQEQLGRRIIQSVI